MFQLFLFLFKRDLRPKTQLCFYGILFSNYSMRKEPCTKTISISSHEVVKLQSFGVSDVRPANA